MRQIRNRIEQIADYIDNNFEKIMAITQVVMVGIMMLCVLSSVIANLIMGNIESFLGIVISLVFVLLIYAILHITWQEFQNEFKK